MRRFVETSRRNREGAETGLARMFAAPETLVSLKLESDFWSLVTVWGSRRNVWENGASIWGKSRGCVRTVDMEGAV